MVVASSGNVLVESTTDSVVVRRAPDCEAEVVRHAPRSFSVASSPDESRMLTGGADGRMQLWDLETLSWRMREGAPPDQ